MSQVTDAVTAWTALASAAAADATNLFRMLVLLPAPSPETEYGRYAGGRAVSPFPGVAAPIVDPTTTVAALEQQAAADRATVATAVAAAQAAAASLAASSAASFATAIQGVTAALLAVIADPADAMRLLPRLANFSPAPLPASSAYGKNEAAIVTAVGAVCRRAALTALARASALYQPQSQADAAAIMESVCGALEAEELIAGDAGADATFETLRAMRAAVAQDLAVRGANLAPVVTVNTGAPLPSLLLANRLYQDSSRAAELMAEADPIHPAFMPTAFQALAR